MLGEEGYELTIASRRIERLEEAAEELRGRGVVVEAVAANMAKEEDIAALFDAHRERFGRLDVLVNNAGVSVPARIEEIEGRYVDLQMDVNLKAVVLGTREGMSMLREAGAEHGKAMIVNTASISGKAGQEVISIYGATKAALINFSQSTHREVSTAGIGCTVLAPGHVATPMTEPVQQHIPGAEMIQPADLAEAVRFLLRTSRYCAVPEIVFMRPGEGIETPYAVGF